MNKLLAITIAAAFVASTAFAAGPAKTPGSPKTTATKHHAKKAAAHSQRKVAKKPARKAHLAKKPGKTAHKA